MTDRLRGKWDPATPLEASWPQGYWLFLAAQYRLFGSAYVSTLLLQGLLAAGRAEAPRDQSSRGDSLIERAFTRFVVGGWAPLGEPPLSDLDGLGTLAGRPGEWALAAVGGAWLIARGGRCTGAPGWLLVAAAGAMVGPALLIGLPLVRYRVPADPIFIIWMVAGVQALRGAQKQVALRGGHKQAALGGGQN